MVVRDRPFDFLRTESWDIYFHSVKARIYFATKQKPAVLIAYSRNIDQLVYYMHMYKYMPQFELPPHPRLNPPFGIYRVSQKLVHLFRKRCCFFNFQNMSVKLSHIHCLWIRLMLINN